MATLIDVNDTCAEELLVTPESLLDLKRIWLDVDDWGEEATDDGLIRITPTAFGAPVFTGYISHSYDDKMARFVSRCEPGSVIERIDVEGFSFIRVEKTASGDTRLAWRSIQNPFRE